MFQTDDIFYALGTEGGGGFLNTFLDAIDGSYCTAKAFGEKGNAAIDPVYPDPNPAGYQGKLQCGVYKPTNVVSISYGEQEDDLPTNYQQRQCAEFLKLALIVWIAIILVSKAGLLHDWRHVVLPIVPVVGIAIGLVLLVGAVRRAAPERPDDE